MRMSKMLTARKTMKKNRLFSIGFVLSGVLSLLFGVVTYYGQNSGNFVMSVDYNAYHRGITLSTDAEFLSSTSQLMTNPVADARDITYSWIKIDNVTQASGNYVDPDFDYIAYTFYLKNDGTESLDIVYSIKITDVHKDLDKSIRVLVIEDGEKTIYQKPDQLDQFGNLPVYPATFPPTLYFLSSQVVTRKKISNLQPGAFKKYSVVIWLEGHDPDTTDDIIGGMVKLQMIFAIDDEV